MNQSQEAVFEQYEQMVMKTTQVIRKSRFMNLEYTKALSWVNGEIKNLTPTEGFTLEEKLEKLQSSKKDLETAIQSLNEEMSTLKNKVETLSPMGKVIWEVSEILCDVH